MGWRPLPIPHPEQLIEIRIAGGNLGFGINPGSYGGLTRPAWEELRRSQDAFAGLFAWSAREMRVGEMSDLHRANGMAVSGEAFAVLGVPAWRGRLIEPADEESACPSSRAVVSYNFWRRMFGDRELTRDARLRINGQLHEIIGITPQSFFGLAVGENYDVAVPFCRPQQIRAEVFDMTVMGRLRAGWTLERASAYVDALSGGIFEATAPPGYDAGAIARYKSFRLTVKPARSGVSVLRDQYDRSLRLLLVLTGLVLLIACANLANLMLARAMAREREIAVRLALGASRVRLLRQFMAETLLLAAAGAALAVGLAQVLSRLLVRSLATDQGGPSLGLATDWRTLLFTAAVAIATCVIFGTAPALRALRMRADVSAPIRGRGLTMSRRRFSVQRLMVVAQIAMSLVLLFAAALFVRSFRNLVTFDPGMRQQGIAVGFIGFDALGVKPDRFIDFRRQLLGEITSIPGVVNAATTTNTPLLGSSWTHAVRVGDRENSSRFTWVSPGYFATMNIPLLQGRDFTFRDTSSSTRVAIVNQSFVRQFLGDANPLGRTLRTLAEPQYPETVYEIIGVIADTRYNSYRSAVQPMAFAPDSQVPTQGPWAAVMIYGIGDAAVTAATVRRALSARYPQMPTEFFPFQARIRSGLVRERLLAMLAGFFGVLAAALVLVGLYGMISFGVAQRRHEIGIRIALGAERRRVITLIMGQAAGVLAIGLVLGAAIALAAAPAAATLLFGLEPTDPVTLASAAVALVAVAALATYIPARRAARLNPLTALRQE